MVYKFSGDMNVGVVPASKNTVWQYTGSSTYTFRLTPDASLADGYEKQYRTFAVKQKNDIVITTLFTTDSGKLKKVTTTIKDYFADPGVNNTVVYKSWFEQSGAFERFVKPNSSEGDSGLYGSVEEAMYYLASTAKNAPDLVFDGTNGTYVYDTKGNDTYISDHTVTDYVYDLAGNDVYESESSGTIRVYDYAGKDVYWATFSGSDLRAYDYAGNDKYSVAKNANAIIRDYAGNDEYTVVDNTNDSQREIDDYKGNDKYYLDNTNAVISDDAGKDTYYLSNGAAVRIYDNGNGNDTFYVDSCTDMIYDKSGTYFKIQNEAGNDTYNITQLTFDEKPDLQTNKIAINEGAGNDKYNIKGNEDNWAMVDNLGIYDGEGNDKYTFTLANSNDAINNVSIIDGDGADTYTLKGFSIDEKEIERSMVPWNSIYGVDINDMLKSNDKYTFDAVDAFSIDDAGGNDTYKINNCERGAIMDWGGNDKYTLTPRYTNWFKSPSKFESPAGYGQLCVNDYGSGNDTYTVDISENWDTGVLIYDEDGNKDSLTLSNAKKGDIVFMANITSAGKCSPGGTFIAYNRTNNSFVSLYDFYHVDSSSGIITGFGDGRVETIKAGSTVLKDVQKEGLYGDFNSLRAEVGAWLADNDYGSVNEALMSNSDVAKATMVAFFTHSEIPQLLPL